MMMCVNSIDFHVLVNGEGVGPILPGRRLKQEDPVSLISLFYVWRALLHYLGNSREREISWCQSV